MSNRDVAPRLRAFDERVTKLEGGGMGDHIPDVRKMVKDLEQKARELYDVIPALFHAEGGHLGCDFDRLYDVILKALADVREADAKVAYSCCHLAGFDMLALDTAAAIRSQGAK